MNAAKPGKGRVFKPRNHAEYPCLLAVLELRLEADEIIERPQAVILPKLNNGIGLAAGMPVGQSDGLHRPVAQRIFAAGCHDLNRQASLEIGRAFFPFLEFGLFRGLEGGEKRQVLHFVHRAVDVILAGSTGARLVVARLEPGDIQIDRLSVDDRGNCIEEGEGVFICQATDCLGQWCRGQRAGRDNNVFPVFGRQTVYFAALNGNQRLIGKRFGNGCGKLIAIDRQSATGRDLVGVRHC